MLLSLGLVPSTVRAQTVLYSYDFEHASDTAGWHLVNGTQPNRWVIAPLGSMGGNALYVSNIDSGNYRYNTHAASLTYAYRQIVLERGAYHIAFDWQCAGERGYDFLRAFLMPDTTRLVAGVLPYGVYGAFFSIVPDHWTPIDGDKRLSQTGEAALWQTESYELLIPSTDTFNLVFIWVNDALGGSQPPAAVDNVVISYSDCPLPAFPYVDPLAPTSLTLHWSDLSRGHATEWLVELDSATQTQGQGSTFSSFDTAFSFYDLSADADYTLYIRPVCGSDTLDSATHLQVRTPCHPLTSLPYVEDFESVPTGPVSHASLPCWRWLGDGLRQIYQRTDSTNYMFTHVDEGDLILLPPIDVAHLSVDGLQLRFSGTANRWNHPRLEVGLTADPTTSSAFVPFDTLVIDTAGWAEYLVEFANISSGYIALRALGTSGFSFDDVVVDRVSPCLPLRQLSVSYVGTTGALVQWDTYDAAFHEPNAYMVGIRRADTVGVADVIATTEPQYLLTGLQPNTDYWVKVRAHCDNDSLSTWDSLRFTTLPLPCAVIDSTLSDTLHLGVDSNHVSGIPVSYLNSYTLCQSIFTADELRAQGLEPGPLVAMDYTFTASPFSHSFSLYVSTAPLGRYPDTGSMVALLPEHLLYGPATLPAGTSGVRHCPFVRPLTWDGVSSLVVTTLINHQNTNYNSATFFYGNSTSTSDNLTLYRFQNQEPYTPSNSHLGAAALSHDRPSVTLYAARCAVEEECVPPSLWVERVEPHAVCLSWIPGNHEEGWAVSYRLAGDSIWTPADTVVSPTSGYCLTGLDPLATYQVRVVPRCGNDSLSAQVEVTTQCANIDILPWHEDFEQFQLSASVSEVVQPCWSRQSNAMSTYFPYLSDQYAYDGSRSLYFGTSRSYMVPYHSHIVLPRVETDVDGLLLSFYVYATSYYRLGVGVMTEPDDFSTFDELAVLTPSASIHTWDRVEIPFYQYTGQGHYIALSVGPRPSNEVYVDHLTLDYLPLCPQPWNVTVDNIVADSATVHWSAPYATSVVLEYGPAGFAHGSGTLDTCVANSATLTGLLHSTAYDVYLRAVCDSDSSGWSPVSSFTTACGVIDRLPYTCTFSNPFMLDGLTPTCWRCGGSSTYFTPSIVPRVGYGSQVAGYALRMVSPSSFQSFAMLPAIDTTLYPLHTLQLVLKASSDSVASSRYGVALIVGVTPNPDRISTFVPVDTLLLTDRVATYDVPLTAAVGSGGRITLLCTSTGSIYIDSVAVEPSATCARPYALAGLTATTTTATVSWQLRDSATAWQLEYMPLGQPLGSGTCLVANSNPYTITGLRPGTAYEFYVRSLCSASDTSWWSSDPGFFVTQQLPATVPFTFGFDSVQEWQGWQTLSNLSDSWYYGTADGRTAPSIYISSDSGTTRSYHYDMPCNVVAYRDIDFGTHDTSFQITFSTSMESNSRYGYNNELVVFLTDPSFVPMQPSSYPGQTPWGEVATFTPIGTISPEGSWRDYSFTLGGLTGVHRLVFYWHNTSIPHTLSNTPVLPAAVDNISVHFEPCSTPFDLHLTSQTMSSASFTWHGSSFGDYRVVLFNSTHSILTDTIVHTNSLQFTNLVPGTHYSLMVVHLCNGLEGTWTNPYYFATDICNDGISDTVGLPHVEMWSYYLPLTTTHSYSYTQQIVLSSELGGVGDITSISFLYGDYGTTAAKTNCTIYMAHTSLSSFSSVNDFVSPADFQVVYMGSLVCAHGWNHLLLDTPFPYDGVSNLVIAIDDNSRAAYPSYHHFIASQTDSPMSLVYYSNSGNIDCSTHNTLASFGGDKTLLTSRANMVFDLCPPNACPTADLLTPRVRVSDVTLRWRRTSDRYLVGYRLMASNRWIVDNLPTSDTFYVINDFFFDTSYVFHIRQYCDSGEMSDWSVVSFNTADIPCLPPLGLRVTRFTNTSARLAWTPDDNNISYRLHVWGGGGYDTIVTTYLASGTVEGLYPASRYHAAVEVSCEYIDEPSVWSDTITFETASCPNATDLVALEVHGNSVLLDWQCDESVGRWQVEWGLQGFDQGTGTTVIADHHPFLLTGLTGETSYDIVVRSVCDDGYVSESWSNRITVTTAYSGIDGASDDLRVRLTPNPTSGDMVLTLPAGMGAVRVEVIDMAGRTLQTYILPAHTARTTLAISQLPQGAYYVRVSSDTFSTVVKALKK